jgi:hypothetical protein
MQSRPDSHKGSNSASNPVFLTQPEIIGYSMYSNAV